ncbi:TetR family transcriptional regulator [Paraburkholderia ginsengiterrae]|uniref:TetR family transcriptional regulator n=1 Tax=Paraburkholderia ginsengiterrae TaxID=1462993 RepID=A0A1A9N2U7_9BURK|nr:TetR/AcrR family transcriptional regulator [Paraburkholderia ginsengiterrae]OAJ55995.1 TetR family transcriptional regulator [Paraburkholderia ginsengiterrae]OAJ58548.1 TetR family transcriptional regulator [Paraburkholderia ginsengiterrae]
MDSVKRSDESQRTRILRIAAQLFAQRGYHGVGMTDLQDAVQLGRGALYHHIKSKEDLLYDISKEYILDLVNVAQDLSRISEPGERLRQMGRHLVMKIASHQAELTVCFREVQSLTDARHSEVLDLHSRYEKLWREVLVEGAEQGLFRPYDPIVLKGMLGMYFYSYLWMRPEGPLGPEMIAERFNELALRMVVIGAPASINVPPLPSVTV